MSPHADASIMEYELETAKDTITNLLAERNRLRATLSKVRAWMASMDDEAWADVKGDGNSFDVHMQHVMDLRTLAVAAVKAETL